LNILDSRDHEIAILENIHHQAETRQVRQRDLARVVGISLGMTNVILKKLAQKGWVKIRKVSNRNIHYAVTPAGLEAISRRSFQFLKRTVKNVVYFKDILEGFIGDLGKKGFQGILLVGKSDFDFILAHLCQKQGLDFSQTDVDTTRDGYCTLYCEDVRPPRNSKDAMTRGRVAFLQEILVSR
jgi:predicted transcriptional regulator